MAQPEKIMPEGGSSPDISPVSPQAPPGPEASADKPWYFSPKYDPKRQDYLIEEKGKHKVWTDPITREKVAWVTNIPHGEVGANASFTGNKDRLQAVQGLLGVQLTPKQEEAVLEAHQVGLGELGRDNSQAGIYNYTQGQISKKARILKEAGFSKEQRRTLVETGIVGVLSPAEFAGFDPNTYNAESALKRIAEQILTTGNANRADEQFLGRISTRIEGLVDSGAIQNAALAQQLLVDLEAWRITAEQPPPTAQRPTLPPSLFQRIFPRLEAAYRMSAGTPQEITARNTAIRTELDRRNNLLREIDALRGPNGERLELFSVARDPLVGIYYGSRVKVSRLEKEGKGEYEGRGTMQKLATLKNVVRDPNIIRADPTGRTAQIVQETKIFLGEEHTDIWSDPRIQAMENLPEVIAFEQRWGMRTLAEGIRGSIDYINREGLGMIEAVVDNRKIYTSDDPRQPVYPNNGLYNVWNTVLKDPAGHALKDEEGEEIVAANFDDVREAIEEARRQEPWVPNRQDWETYIRFVADDREDLEEMIPYIVAKVVRKLGTGQPDKLSNRGEQEKERLDGAMANFPVESEQEFRRLKSILNANLNSTLTYFFSDQVRIDWGPYISYLNLLAEGTQNTEQQDHLIDALILDKDGFTMLACQQFLENDGIYWRYGQTSANLAKGVRDINKLYRWQIKRKREITKFLMNHKLRRMDDLLDLTVDRNGNITGYGVPKHPAFQRLKALYDEQDAADIRNTPGHDILDADGQSTNETRWQEYCRKALEWQRTGKFGDPGEAPRVIFQHPLARSFKRPVRTATGVNYEFLDMFEEDRNVSLPFLNSIQKGTKARNATWYERAKRRKVKSNMQKAEQLCRNLMLDSAAVLAWHVFKTSEEVDEVNEYLQAAGMEPITINEAVPQKRLYRALMQALIKEDRTKLPKDRTFKIYDVLTQLLDIDIDIPTFGAWYIGAHDTGRPSLLLAAIDKDTRPGSLKDAMPASGKDEKNTGAMWAEKERRMGLLLQMVMFAKFGKILRKDGKKESRYFNFPGHDTKGAERKGAGVKDIRNYLNLLYGTSTDTVWLNDLLDIALPLEPEPTKNHGATEDVITEYVGLAKGGNEAVFAQTGYEGVLENPRDMVSAVKRTATNQEHSKTLTTGNKEGFAVLKDGPFRRMYKWRDYSLGVEGKYNHDHKQEQFFAIDKPQKAMEDMKESTYRAGVDLAAETIEPLVIAMKGVVESTFGPNPGTARFARTLLALGSLKWADTSWEYRTKPGFAIDGNLHLARYFMHQYLLEYGDNGLIYDDKEWDEIMLGYIVKSDGTHVIRYEVEAAHPGETKEYEVDEQTGSRNGRYQWVSGTVQEGLIDAFPKRLRDEILEGRDVQIKDKNGNVVYTYKDYILPFGLNSKYPETMANYYREKKQTQLDYKGALGQIAPRKAVTRP